MELRDPGHLSSRRQPRTPEDVFQNLLGLPPRPRIVLGLVALAIGAFLTVYLWDRGVVWGLSLFAITGGIGLLITGLLDRRKELKLLAYRQSIKRRAPELLKGLAEAKRQGKNLVQWLNEQGVTDVATRARLIEILNNRLRAAKSSPGRSDEEPDGDDA